MDTIFFPRGSNLPAHNRDTRRAPVQCRRQEGPRSLGPGGGAQFKGEQGAVTNGRDGRLPPWGTLLLEEFSRSSFEAETVNHNREWGVGISRPSN